MEVEHRGQQVIVNLHLWHVVGSFRCFVCAKYVENGGNRICLCLMGLRNPPNKARTPPPVLSANSSMSTSLKQACQATGPDWISRVIHWIGKDKSATWPAHSTRLWSSKDPSPLVSYFSSSPYKSRGENTPFSVNINPCRGWRSTIVIRQSDKNTVFIIDEPSLRMPGFNITSLAL